MEAISVETLLISPIIFIPVSLAPTILYGKRLREWEHGLVGSFEVNVLLYDMLKIVFPISFAALYLNR